LQVVYISYRCIFHRDIKEQNQPNFSFILPWVALPHFEFLYLVRLRELCMYKEEPSWDSQYASK